MAPKQLPDGRVAVLLSAHAEELIGPDARAIADYLERFPATTVTEVARQLRKTRRVRRHRAVLRAADRLELAGNARHRLLHHLRRPLGLRLSAHPLELLGRIGLIRRELLHGIGRMRPPI